MNNVDKRTQRQRREERAAWIALGIAIASGKIEVPSESINPANVREIVAYLESKDIDGAQRLLNRLAGVDMLDGERLRDAVLRTVASDRQRQIKEDASYRAYLETLR